MPSGPIACLIPGLLYSSASKRRNNIPGTASNKADIWSRATAAAPEITAPASYADMVAQFFRWDGSEDAAAAKSKLRCACSEGCSRMNHHFDALQKPT